MYRGIVIALVEKEYTCWYPENSCPFHTLETLDDMAYRQRWQRSDPLRRTLQILMSYALTRLSHLLRRLSPT
jgi:hypothetical protein